MAVQKGPHSGRKHPGFRLAGSLAAETVTPVSLLETADRATGPGLLCWASGWLVHWCRFPGLPLLRPETSPHRQSEVLSRNVFLPPRPLGQKPESCSMYCHGGYPCLSSGKPLHGRVLQDPCDLREGVGLRVGWREAVYCLLSWTQKLKTPTETRVSSARGPAMPSAAGDVNRVKREEKVRAETEHKDVPGVGVAHCRQRPHCVDISIFPKGKRVWVIVRTRQGLSKVQEPHALALFSRGL